MSGKVRARDLDIPFEGTPGRWNAITDVPGVRVGHTTLIRDGKSDASDAVRTGVTVVVPKPRTEQEAVFAGWFRLNGYGELTGTAWIDEAGLLDGPVVTTNTHSVGVAHAAIAAYAHGRRLGEERWSLPVVGETWDGYLNDLWGDNVTSQHVLSALAEAQDGPVAEGSVGGGTGTIAYEFKAGIGTASRKVSSASDYTLGVLVQSNQGRREQLQIAGVPVGREFAEDRTKEPDSGSIIGIVATDAPLLPHQLKRLARRCALGLARSGSVSGHGSGDLFLAFSTANDGQVEGPKERRLAALPEDALNPFFAAVVSGLDESVINSLVAAETMSGLHHRRAVALPHDRLRSVLKRHGRLG